MPAGPRMATSFPFFDFDYVSSVTGPQRLTNQGTAINNGWFPLFYHNILPHFARASKIKLGGNIAYAVFIIYFSTQYIGHLLSTHTTFRSLSSHSRSFAMVEPRYSKVSDVRGVSCSGLPAVCQAHLRKRGPVSLPGRICRAAKGPF